MNSQRSTRRELARLLAETRDALGTTGYPTSHEVADKVLADHADLVKELGSSLAVSHVYAMATDCMRAATVEPHQFHLPFELKSVPGWISFESMDGRVKEIRYVPLRRANEIHLKSHARILRLQIRNDSARLDSVEALTDFLKPIFEEFPGIDVEAACEIYRERNEPDQDDDPHGDSPIV